MTHAPSNQPASAEPGTAPAILPGELFARLLGGSVRHGTFAGESRGAPRVVVNRRALLRRCGAGTHGPAQPEACTLRDISVSGVGLLLETRMEPGQAFVLVVNDPRGSPAALPCIVVRERPAGQDSRRFMVGARYIKDLPRMAPATTPPAVPGGKPAPTRSFASPRLVGSPPATPPVPASPAHAEKPPVTRESTSRAAEVERIRAAMLNG
ncbi:MAG TPA: PilZ domain-containing protein [Humisphaera sp.]